MASIFLCHSSKDKFFVRELARRLGGAGIRVWLDEAELNVGDSLVECIGSAIEEMDFFGAVLSSSSIDSPWVQRELRVAIDREFKERKVVVLPILLEPVDLPPFLRGKLYADFTTTERSEDAFPKLLRSMGVSAATSPSLPAPAEVKPPPATDDERRLAAFQDICIVDLDTDRSNKPDPKMALFNMYLRLSATPPRDWTEVFLAERKFPRHTMWRQAWIEGGFIVVHCVPDELERYHVRDLREDVTNTNQKYREYLLEAARRSAKAATAADKERAGLRDIRRRLGFD